MIKAVLLDGDGVTIKPHDYFSQRLKESEVEVDEQKFTRFIKTE